MSVSIKYHVPIPRYLDTKNQSRSDIARALQNAFGEPPIHLNCSVHADKFSGLVAAFPCLQEVMDRLCTDEVVVIDLEW